MDLPGYGYSKIAHEVSSQWAGFIEPYLRQRSNLALCVALVDSNIPAQASDQQLIEFLHASGRNFIVVATKADRVPSTRLQSTLATLIEGLKGKEILPYSAKTGAGRSELWARIREATQVLTQPIRADTPSDNKSA